MIPQLSVQSVRSSKRAMRLLDWPLDFALSRADKKAKWFALASGQALEVIAGDGSGGQFALCGDGNAESLPLLYVSSEGAAGTIGGNLTEGLQVLVALPYWRDLLKFSGGGKLTEMRKAARHCEQEIRELEPDIDELREELYRELRLKAIDDPIKVLHKAVKRGEKSFCVVSPDGGEFETLFNTFVTSDNRGWS